MSRVYRLLPVAATWSALAAKQDDQERNRNGNDQKAHSGGEEGKLPRSERRLCVNEVQLDGRKRADLTGEVERRAAAVQLQHGFRLAPRVRRSVVVLGQVRQHDVPEPAMEHLRQELRRLRVREVSQVRPDAALQR